MIHEPGDDFYYYIADLGIGETGQTTLVAKFYPDHTKKWMRLHKILAISSMLDITSDKEFLFFGGEDESLVISKVETEEGFIARSLRLDGYQAHKSSQLSTFPDSPYVFFSMHSKSDNYGRVCRWSYINDGTDIHCRIFDGMNTPRAIATISFSEVYSITNSMEIRAPETQKILLINTDFWMNRDRWSKEIP